MGNETSQPRNNNNRPQVRPPRPPQQKQPQKPPVKPQQQYVEQRPREPTAQQLSQVALPMQFVAPPVKSVSMLMERPVSTKEGLRDADIMNINQRVEEFKTSQKDEEQHFLQNLEKAKEQFYQKQKTKKSQFEDELKEFEMKYNPFRILHLDYNATEDDVKKAYRRFSLKYHPDKPGGNAKKFMMITQAYVYLLQKIKEMSGNKSHNEMRKEAQDYFEDMEKKRQEIKGSSATLGYDPDDQMEISSDKNFDNDKFNKIFEKNRMPTQYDRGYGGDWGDDSDHEDQVVFNKKFTIDLFNETFNQMQKKKREEKPQRQLIIVEEPQPQVLSNLGFEELGKGDIDDFTNDRVCDRMQFSDYKAAYTRNNVLEYDDKFNRGDFKNLDHLVSERGKANFDLTNEDKARLNKREMLMKQQEEQRIQNMMAFDRMAEQYSQRANMHFIKNK